MIEAHEFWVNEEFDMHQWECTCRRYGPWVRLRALAEENGLVHMDLKHPEARKS